MASVYPSSWSWVQKAAVRRHCQTMARPTGWPVALSQSRAVSRWLARPRAAMSPGATPLAATHRAAAWSWLSSSSRGSCSTQPGWG